MAHYDAQATRRRLLDAAYAEFAQYGLAGARVERIGEAADSNKAQIYHYFGGKTQLFDAVFELTSIEMATEVPFTPHDLPGYAGRLVRLHDRRPEIMRLVTWQRLERFDAEPNMLAVAAVRSQVDAIADVQKAGGLPAHFPPGVIFGLVLHIATGWTALNPEFEAGIEIPDLDERVRHVENAVRALVCGAGQPGTGCGSGDQAEPLRRTSSGAGH